MCVFSQDEVDHEEYLFLLKNTKQRRSIYTLALRTMAWPKPFDRYFLDGTT